MLGSLTIYRRLLADHVFAIKGSDGSSHETARKLPAFGHGIAGLLAGWTVSFVAAPVEHVKARLQVQYAVDKSKRMYSGPIDCGRRLVRPTLDLL